MRQKSLIFCAWVAVLFTAGPALADITVNVNVSWHDFAAAAAAVDVSVADGSDHRVCLLTMSGPSSGTCTVSFPDPDAGSGATTVFANTISLVTCDQSVFLDTNGVLSVFAPSCGTAGGGNPPGAWLRFSAGDGVTANAGATVPYDVTLPPDTGAGTITGKISLPPGAQIAQGTVEAFSFGDGTVALQAYAAISGPNADGSYGYSVPLATTPGFGSLIFAMRLPSGREASFFFTAPANPTPGGAVPFDVPASMFTYVTGSVGWNTLSAASGLLSISGPSGSNGPIAIAADHLSGTYDALLLADSAWLPTVTLSTCANALSCHPGVVAFFSSLAPIDTSGLGGTSITYDVPLPASFTTFSGAVSLDGATVQSGVGTVTAFNLSASQFVTTTFDFGHDGLFDALVGQGPGASAQFLTTAAECSAPLDASFSLDLGPDPFQENVPIHVNAALPGAAAVTVGLDALAGLAPPARYEVKGAWQGDASVAYCNGGATSVDQIFDGTTITNLRAGPWSFSNVGSGTQTAGGASFMREFAAPPQLVTVPAGGSAAVTFIPNPPAFSGGLDTTSWQIDPGDSAYLQAIASSTNGDGSSSVSQDTTLGPPPANSLSIELIVAPNEPLAPASLVAGASYQTGPTSGSSWASSLTPVLPTLTTGQVQSMPGLADLQIAGVGTWTVTSLPVPAGAAFAQAVFSAQAGHLGLSGFADIGSSSQMRLKLPAGSYGAGPQVAVSYLDPSQQFVSNVYPIGGEIAPGDALTDTVRSPVLLNRTPAPGTYCAPGGDGTTRIDVAFTVATGVQQLKSVTVAGKPVKADGSGNVGARVVLPLGTWPLNVSATQNSGDRTTWDRTYTVPSQMSSQAPIGVLVPDGTNPVPLPTASIKASGTVELSLVVSSCGRLVSNANAYARPPRIVAISRNGQNLPLATIAPGALDADGDIPFELGGNGVWTLKLKTTRLGPGTFLVKLQAPDASLWDGILVVRQ